MVDSDAVIAEVEADGQVVRERGGEGKEGKRDRDEAGSGLLGACVHTMRRIKHACALCVSVFPQNLKLVRLLKPLRLLKMTKVLKIMNLGGIDLKVLKLINLEGIDLKVLKSMNLDLDGIDLALRP